MLRVLGLILGFFVGALGIIGVVQHHPEAWPFAILGPALFIYSVLKKGPNA